MSVHARSMAVADTAVAVRLDGVTNLDGAAQAWRIGRARLTAQTMTSVSKVGRPATIRVGEVEV